MPQALDALAKQIASCPVWQPVGRITRIAGHSVHLSGLQHAAHIGDQVNLRQSDGATIAAEVISIEADMVRAMTHVSPDRIALGDMAILAKDNGTIAPSDSWIGRIIDPFGRPLDGTPLLPGTKPRSILALAPLAHDRSGLGGRLNTGLAAMNTFLPVVAGQRLGLFAGSGVGKSSLIAALCREMESDVVVVALVGERGRELQHFVSETLGSDGMARTVIVAATSDQSPLIRRRCAWSAMAVAEHFRDQGRRVLFVADSITRFAEAHRDIALAAGEFPALRGFPASTSQLIMSLCERAGPGRDGEGMITGLFSVLVAGSDFDEPIADILRGTLDGHIVLNRSIAERGRYPAVDLLKSVSRSLPAAATEEENAMLTEGRRLLSLYEASEVMIRSGLYSQGAEAQLDRAVRAWDELDQFLARSGEANVAASFDRLNLILRRAGPATLTK